MMKETITKVKHIITGNVYSVNKFNKEKHIPYIPEVKKLLPNDLTLTCKQCGNQQTYVNKYSYRRAMGITGLGKQNKQENSGLCGKCRRAEKRIPHGPRSKEWIKNNRLIRIKEQGYNSIEEFENDIHNKKKYMKLLDDMSRTNLKREKPELYKLWNENKWDGKDLNKLTIEHKKPKSVCWGNRIPIAEAAHIDNLEVITMKENNERWKDFEHSKKVKQKLIGKIKYQQKIEAGDNWAWHKNYSREIPV